MSFKTIQYEVAEGVARIRLNRPAQRNALNEWLILEIDEAAQQAEANPDVRAIVLSGNGPSFSSGHDLRVYPREEGALYSAPNAELRWMYERKMFYDKCLSIWDLSKPTIAQVQGHCLAAGLMLAGVCDIIVASDDALFGDPVCRMGAAAVELLIHPWLFGPRKAKEMLLTGDPVTAAEALTLGVVNRVVPAERLEDEVTVLARRIAATPPFAARMVKHSINRTLDIVGFRNTLNAHFDTHQVGHATEEMQQLLYQAREQKGLKQFLAGRDAPYK